MMTTWERYFYRELIKSSFFFLAIFYGLYVLIDYSSHLSGANYHHSKLNLGELLIHYGCEFSARADILIPFSLLIGTIHTLTKLNTQSELIALLASGYSLHRLLIPYVVVGLLGVGFLYLNNEIFLPKASLHLVRLDDKYSNRKNSFETMSAKHLTLEDGSLLVYKNFDQGSKKFQQVFWIPHFEEVWRMEELDPFLEKPQGNGVDQFIRKAGNLIYNKSYFQFSFPKMSFNQKKLHETLKTPDQLSLSTLLKAAPDEQNAKESEKSARILTALYRKLALPWLALLAVIGIAPFCLKFTRHLPVFFIFAGGIFGLVAIYLVIDAATVLGERQVFTPSSAIFLPMGAFLATFIFRFIKMRT